MKTSKRVLANLAVFGVVFAVMILWAISNVVSVDQINRPYEISGEFAAAAGVAEGAEVAYLGVHFGKVKGVELCTPASADPCQDDSVRITMLIDRGKEIPRGSVARVFRKSAIGEPYIDFQPPADFDADHASASDYLQAGDRVALADTRTPLEFAELLRTFSDLLSHVDPAQAGTVVHELSLALDGRAEDLRRLTTAGDQLTSMLAEHTDALDRLAVNNTELTQVLADHRSSIGSSITDLAALADALHQANGDTSVLLDRGTALLGTVGDLLDDTRPDIDCLLDDLVTVNHRLATPDQLAGLRSFLDIGPKAFGEFWTTRDQESDGLWVRVNLLIETSSPADQFVPAKSLPAVPAVPACSNVVAAGTSTPLPSTDFHPSSVLGSSTRSVVLPATGAAAGIGVAGVVLLLAWATRRLARTVPG